MDPSPEPRQRWRIVFRRQPVPPDQVGRAAVEAWQSSLEGSGLPIARLGDVSSRPRVAFAAPLPAAARGDAELVEVWLVERRPLWAVREALGAMLPASHDWVDGEDIWLGAPALAGRVAAADWLVTVSAADPSRPTSTPDAAIGPLRRAIDALAAATSIPRVRLKGTVEKAYDLRPLLADVHVVDDGTATRGATIAMRTRFDPELGSGRPDEVIAAIADVSGLQLTTDALVRTGLLLNDGDG